MLAQVEKAWHSPLAILSSLGTSGAYSAFLALGLLVALVVALLAYQCLIPSLGKADNTVNLLKLQ